MTTSRVEDPDDRDSIVMGKVVDRVVPYYRSTEIRSNILDRFSCRSMLGEHRKAVLNLIDELIRCRLVVFGNVAPDFSRIDLCLWRP